jgi:1,4-alpha-glucan branching enzyme
VCNLTPLPRTNYRLGVPLPGLWRELLNSDARDYGGAGWGNLGTVESSPLPSHGRPHALTLTLPPLSTLILKLETHA